MNSSFTMKIHILPLVLLASHLAGPSAASVDQAIASIKSGDLGHAESILLPLATSATPDPSALHQLSIVRLRQQRAAEAVSLAEEAVKLAPQVAGHHVQLGSALAQRMAELPFMQQAVTAGRMKRAFEQALGIDPRHVGALIGLTRWYSNAPEIAGGSPEKAAEYAARVREVVPWLGELELGQIAERADQHADALARYEAAAALRPDHAPAQEACGRVLAALGRKDEARARFEAALKLNPDLETARQGLSALGR